MKLKVLSIQCRTTSNVARSLSFFKLLRYPNFVFLSVQTWWYVQKNRVGGDKSGIEVKIEQHIFIILINWSQTEIRRKPSDFEFRRKYWIDFDFTTNSTRVWRLKSRLLFVVLVNLILSQIRRKAEKCAHKLLRQTIRKMQWN